MPRYIDADKLGIGRANPTVFVNEAYAKGWNAVIDILEQATTLSPDDVRPVGKWLHTSDEFGTYEKCSCCGKEYYCGPIVPFNYCPNCGARLEVSEDARD